MNFFFHKLLSHFTQFFSIFYDYSHFLNIIRAAISSSSAYLKKIPFRDVRKEINCFLFVTQKKDSQEVMWRRNTQQNKYNFYFELNTTENDRPRNFPGSTSQLK